MSIITVSSKYQIVIPKEVRESLHIKPGQKLQALVVGGSVQLVPVEPIRGLKGFLGGVENDFTRDEDRL